MNIAILSDNQIDTSEIVSQLNPCLVLKSSHTDYDKQLADLGLQLEEHMLFNNKSIDLVCVVKDSIDCNKLLETKIDPYDNKVCYFSQDYTGSYYCSPSVFMILSSLYKVNFEKLYFKNLNNASEILHAEKLMFLITRLGIQYYAI